MTTSQPISRSPSPPSSSQEMASAALLAQPLNNGNLANPQLRQGEMPRPYKCPLCDKAFHRLEHQTRHIRTHTGEKPHACTFPGCTKRFSRSDELTRHTRIHSNPNSRRNHAKGAVLPLTSMEHSSSSHSRSSPPLDGHMMPPPNHYSSSNSSSRNHSPHHSPESLSYHSSPDQGHLDQDHQMDILASAASSQLERERSSSLFPPMSTDPYSSSRYQYNMYPPQSHHHSHHHHHHQHHTYPHSNKPLSSFPYNYNSRSNPMSRTSSHDHIEDDFVHHRVRKSRPNSPTSTAPPSPTYSSSPISTPSVTPAHSPRLFPRDFGAEPYNYEHGKLPSIRGLSLGARFDYDTTPASTPPILGHGMLPPPHSQVDNPANMSTLTKMLERKSERPSPMSLDSLLLPTSPPRSGRASVSGSVSGHEE
jgi:zinc-finger protein CreA/MIG